jgi:serine/threonine protein kinase
MLDMEGGFVVAQSQGRGNFEIAENEIIIGELLGEGAFGAVHLSTFRRTEVAVKRLRIESPTESDRSEILQEAKLLVELKPHPNLVQVLGFCSLPPMIVMEYCEGGSLLRALKNERNPLTLLEKKRICHGIIMGMIHLHAERIIHRDLAARNILLTQNKLAKVTDFGLSRIIGIEYEQANTRSSIGAVRWMSPEAIDKQIYSKSSDVWSFGILVWEIASNGKVPYEQFQSIASLVKAIQKKNVQLNVPDETAPLFKQIISLCTKKDPRRRPTFEQLDDLIKEDLEASKHAQPERNNSSYVSAGQYLNNSAETRLAETYLE